jgi:CubicO group peptidase (beta-lactamase class C family)
MLKPTAILAAVFAVMSGLSAMDVTGAASYSLGHGERALLVMSSGRVVFERYREGDSADRLMPVFSITKSLSALTVLSLSGSSLPALDEPLEKSLTFRQLLSQSSGLPPDYAGLYASPRLNKSRRMAALQPGNSKAFLYGPSHYEWVASYLERKLGPGSARRLAAARILNPLGIDATQWRTDYEGSVFYSAGLAATPRQLLRAGRLVERGGWAGLRKLVPAPLLKEALTGSAANPAYGLGFWLNQAAASSSPREGDIEEALTKGWGKKDWASFCLSKSAPADLVAMAGSGGQRVYVSSSRRLVIVRMGTASNFRDHEFLAKFFKS